MNKSHYAIIGPMRSGSSFLFRNIRDLSSDYRSKLRVEFFQYHLPGWAVRDNGTELVPTHDTYLPFYDEQSLRLELLKKYNYAYTIKCLPTQLTVEVMNMLVGNYKIIICDRKNKFEQFLSWIVAIYTNSWNSRKQLGRLKQFTVDEDAVNFYACMMANWNIQRNYILEKNMHVPPVVYYEDLTRNVDAVLQRTTDLTIVPRSAYYVPLQKLFNHSVKKEMIKNYDWVKKQFDKKIKSLYI